jgi:Flp pilus assembly protein CpaB
MQDYRRRGQVSIPYLLTFAVAALLAVVLAARQVNRALTTRVVMARDGIRAGERIDPSRLVFGNLSKGDIPAGSVLDPAAIAGRIVQRPVAAGHPLTAADFAAPVRPVTWLADAPPPGHVVITVSVPGTLLPVQQLRDGDRLDLLAVSSKGQSHVVGRDAFLIGSILGRREPRRNNSVESLVPSAERRAVTSIVGLVLAVRPQDASPIAQAQGTGEQLSFVIHGRREVLSGRMLDISTPPAASSARAVVAREPRQVELISGAHRQKVDLN